MTTKGLPNYDELEDKQREVVNELSYGDENPISYVQGIAGSGKTTIGLLATDAIARHYSGNNCHTVLFLTYNDRLTKNCINKLVEKLDLRLINIERDTTSQFISAKNLNPLKVNLMTFRDLLCLGIDIKDELLSDNQSISIIEEQVEHRGISDLLPSQIFSLITTILRGQLEFVELEPNSLRNKLLEWQPKFEFYSSYADALNEITLRLLGAYEWKKSGRLDRADIAYAFYKQQQQIIQNLSIIHKTDDVKSVRKAILDKLVDQADPLHRALLWSADLFQKYMAVPEISKRAEINYQRVHTRVSLAAGAWRSLKSELFDWIYQYGLIVDPLWSRLLKKLVNPIIIIDEVQDMSQIELFDLSYLWFQLPKNDRNHIIFLGDTNQQITPTGFNWINLESIINEISQTYRRSIQIHRYNLSTNYRTTKEIANAVKGFIYPIASAVLPESQWKEYRKNIIDPENTKLTESKALSRTKLIEAKNDSEIVIPVVLIGELEDFIRAIDRYLKRLSEEPRESNEEDYLSTVIITDNQELEKRIGQDLKNYSLPPDRVEVIKIMDCKGMEFERCIIVGIGECPQTPTIDLISKWYTEFSRAELVLMVHLNPNEAEYLRGFGWDPGDEVITVVSPTEEKMLERLELAASNEMSSESRVSFGERHLNDFIDPNGPHNREDLDASIRQFKIAGFSDGLHRAAFEGAAWFEKQGDFLEAARYFDIGHDQVGKIRCFIRYSKLDGVPDKCKYYESAQTETEEIDDPYIQAECWLLFEEYSKALDVARYIEDRSKAIQISEKVLDLQERFIQSNEIANDIAIELEKFGFYKQSAEAWLRLRNWEKSFSCAQYESNAFLFEIGSRAIFQAQSLCSSVNEQDKAAVAQLLSLIEQDFSTQSELLLRTADLRDIRKEFLLEIKDLCTVCTNDALNKAISVTRNISVVTDQFQSYILLAKAFEKNGLFTDAYYYYYLAKNSDEQHRLITFLEENYEYRIVIQCYLKTGNRVRAEKKVNDLRLSTDKNIFFWVALCYEDLARFDDAAQNLMNWYNFQVIQFGEIIAYRLIDYPEKYRDIFCTYINSKSIDFGMNPEQIERLNEFIPKDNITIHLVEQLNLLFKNPDWRNEFRIRYELLKDRLNYLNINLVKTDYIQLSLKSVDEIRQIWNALDNGLAAIQHRAVKDVNEYVRNNRDNIDEIQRAYYFFRDTCENPSEAQDLVESLYQRRKYEQWINLSFRIKKFNINQLNRLDEFANRDLINRTINRLNNPKDKELARAKHIDRLKTKNTPKAWKYLEKTYGVQNVTPLPSEIKTEKSEDLDNLFNELSELAKRWLSADDFQELQEQIKRLLEVKSTPKRLSSKWKAVKGILKDQLTNEIIIQIEKIIINYLEHDQSTAITKNEKSKKELVVSHRKNGPLKNRGKFGKEAQKYIVDFIKEDFHPRGESGFYSIEDAKQIVEAHIEDARQNRNVKVLHLIHGPDVLLLAIRWFLKNNGKRFDHIERVIPGEQVQRLNKEYNYILASAPDFPIDTISTSFGETFVIFR